MHAPTDKKCKRKSSDNTLSIHNAKYSLNIPCEGNKIIRSCGKFTVIINVVADVCKTFWKRFVVELIILETKALK